MNKEEVLNDQGFDQFENETIALMNMTLAEEKSFREELIEEYKKDERKSELMASYLNKREQVLAGSLMVRNSSGRFTLKKFYKYCLCTSLAMIALGIYLGNIIIISINVIPLLILASTYIYDKKRRNEIDELKFSTDED